MRGSDFPVRTRTQTDTAVAPKHPSARALTLAPESLISNYQEGKLTEEPALVISRIESLATRELTSCGAGAMVWRAWGEGRPLVLLHGASGSWTHWILNILALARQFRVIVPDMPGFGDSDAPPEPHTADLLADLVASGLDVIVPPPADLDMAGFSLGGIIGGLVARRLGRRIRTLVLLGPGGLRLPPAPRRPLRSMRPDMTPEEIVSAHRENLRILMIANPERVDDLAVLVQMENVRRARFKSGTIPTSDALLQALPSIQARVTGIWGGRDAFVAPHVEERRQALGSVHRDLDFRVIGGAGHWVSYEAADQVNAILLDMLRVTP